MATTTADPAVFSAIKHMDDLIGQTQVALNETVAMARRHGATWTQIGDALGVTRQAATQRFHSVVGEPIGAVLRIEGDER